MNEILKEDAIQIIESNNGLKELYNTKFLITGATGMIGSTFVNTLLTLNELYNANVELYLVIRNKKKLPKYILDNPNVHIVEQDITNPIKCEVSADYVIHAASPASPLIMKECPVETNFANTIGTANALIYAKNSNAKGFLFISSREIYGQPEEGQEYFYENGKYGQIDHLVPRNGYSEGKKAAENMCAGFKQEYGLNTKIVRLAHTYGPGMSIYDGRVQADFLKNVVHNEDIVLKSTGEAIRTYTYISDAVNAMFKVLLNSKDIVYNIADEKSKTSIKQLAESLVNIYPERNLKLVFDIQEPSNNNGCASFTLGILSTDKIKKELGWEPKYSIHDGFKRTIEFIESELKKEDVQKLVRKSN
jgi:UDP-glucuronate decarboxylase